MARIKSISKIYFKSRWDNFLNQDSKGNLFIDTISVNYLAKKYGTPLYILAEKEIRARLREFKKSFPYPKLRVQYACKCNSNLEIMRIVRDEGMELDASSVGEIILAMLADFKPKQITFTNLYKSKQDITFAAKIGVQAITADSLEELRRMESVGRKLRKRINIFIRINPMIDYKKYTSKKHQYGIPISQAWKALDYAMFDSSYLNLTGLHFHGSYIDYPNIYFLAAKKLIQLMRYCADYGINLKAIDLGGGFPVEYNSKKVFRPKDMGESFIAYFNNLLKKYELPKPTLIFEPGKFIVANAGIGLIRVISEKKLGRNRKTIITNGSTYSMLPDPLIYKCHYEILPANKMLRRRTDKVNIAGCTCDSIDIIGHNRKLPKLEENDLLAVMDCGAYSNVMASNFNTLKRPPMVMIKKNGIVQHIRRRDRYSEMFAPELDVLKIADTKELKKFYDLFRINVDKLWQGTGKKK